MIRRASNTTLHALRAPAVMDLLPACVRRKVFVTFCVHTTPIADDIFKDVVTLATINEFPPENMFMKTFAYFSDILNCNG
jgi:hypothetical protein